MKHHSTEPLLCVVLDFGRRGCFVYGRKKRRLTDGEARVGVAPAGLIRRLACKCVYVKRKRCQFFWGRCCQFFREGLSVFLNHVK